MTSGWSAPRRTPSILSSPSPSPVHSPASRATLSPASSASSSPAPSPLPRRLPPHSFTLLPPLEPDPHTRLTLQRVLHFSHPIADTHPACFRLQCLSLADHQRHPVVRAAQRMLRDAFHNDGSSSRDVYYLCVTSTHSCVAVIAASYFIVHDEVGGAALHLNTFLTRVEMRGLGFGALLLEAYREVVGRVARCREWRGQAGGCELVVHSVADKIGWWQRMGCECSEKRVKVSGEGFDNTFPMRDLGRRRSDDEMRAIVQRITTFTPGAEEWGA